MATTSNGIADDTVTEWVAVTDLADGNRIIADVDDDAPRQVVTVEMIEVDSTDETMLALTYRDENGTLGVLSVDENDDLERVAEN